VVVFDSGVGGLPYLQRLREFLPDETFSYVADTANFPYGEKSTAELNDIVHRQMERLIHRIDPKLVVVACNTASVVALSELRAAFGLPFVGVVPAVKPAAETTDNKRIGLIATRKTVEDPYTDMLESRFASHCRMYRYAGVDIVDLIEYEYFSHSSADIERVLRPAVDYFLDMDIDRLILACTHFIFLEKELGRMLGDSVTLVDSRDGVARQTGRIIEGEGLCGPGGGQGSFFITGTDGNETYSRFAEMFGITWRGTL
jgi:glutamate racemase